MQVMEVASGASELSDKVRRVIQAIQKQDRLLYLCFYLLLNIAEDASVQRKMHKKNIVQHLIHMLDRSNVELLILAVMFLKTMSIYRENKNQMVKVRIRSFASRGILQSLLRVAATSQRAMC
jgi:hypothetical protein